MANHQAPSDALPMAYLCNMKKTTYVACALGMLLVAAPAALAQISVVDAPDTVEVYLDELELSGFDFAKADWGVANEGSESLAVMVTRTFVDTVSPFNYPFDWANTGSYERFCWGPQCYNFGSNNSALAESFLVNIDTGQVDMSFQSDFYPAGVLGSTTLEYCFHEVDALESGVCHRVTYVVDASVRIDGPEDLAERGMAIAPNPASASTTITVDASNKGVLEFRNLVGQIAKSVAVVPHTQGQRISLEDLPDGLWLVSHKVNGSVVATKRLVKH